MKTAMILEKLWAGHRYRGANLGRTDQTLVFLKSQDDAGPINRKTASLWPVQGSWDAVSIFIQSMHGQNKKVNR